MNTLLHWHPLHCIWISWTKAKQISVGRIFEEITLQLQKKHSICRSADHFSSTLSLLQWIYLFGHLIFVWNIQPCIACNSNSLNVAIIGIDKYTRTQSYHTTPLWQKRFGKLNSIDIHTRTHVHARAQFNGKLNLGKMSNQFVKLRTIFKSFS